MKLLLDTHVILWWLRDNPKLGSNVRALIADPQTTAMVSVASFWEFSIKSRIGKLDEAGSRLFAETVSEGFPVLGVEQGHLVSLEALERRAGHNDPFDHLILAQAAAEGAAIITDDGDMPLYGIRCFPASR